MAVEQEMLLPRLVVREARKAIVDFRYKVTPGKYKQLRADIVSYVNNGLSFYLGWCYPSPFVMPKGGAYGLWDNIGAERWKKFESALSAMSELYPAIFDGRAHLSMDHYITKAAEMFAGELADSVIKAAAASEDNAAPHVIEKDRLLRYATIDQWLDASPSPLIHAVYGDIRPEYKAACIYLKYDGPDLHISGPENAVRMVSEKRFLTENEARAQIEVWRQKYPVIEAWVDTIEADLGKYRVDVYDQLYYVAVNETFCREQTAESEASAVSGPGFSSGKFVGYRDYHSLEKALYAFNEVKPVQRRQENCVFPILKTDYTLWAIQRKDGKRVCSTPVFIKTTADKKI